MNLELKKWYRLLEHRKQVRFDRCRHCGKMMVFQRPTGVGYAIHHPAHYSSSLCGKCQTLVRHDGGPGGGTKRVSYWLREVTGAGFREEARHGSKKRGWCPLPTWDNEADFTNIIREAGQLV